MNDQLRDRLLALAAKDERVRARLAADGSLFRGYHPEMEAVHVENAVALEAILAQHGWPGESLVGADGAEAAWRIVQHAIGLPDFQRRCLVLQCEAVGRGEIPGWQPAYLDDRIRSFEGRPQRYGTQFDWDADGLMSPVPIEEPEKVDDRRAALGLPPLAEAIARHRAEAGAQPAPRDAAARRRERDEWLVKTGWKQP